MKFDSKTHTYYNDKGEVIPNVTSIVHSVMNSESLLSWAYYMGIKGDDYRSFRRKRGEIGTQFHSKAECFFQKDKTYENTGNVEVENIAIECFNLFLKWVEEAKPDVVFQEKMLMNERYAGTLDMLCYISGNLILIDLKTSKVISMDYFLQLGGYLNLLHDCYPDLYKKIKGCEIISCNEVKGLQIKAKSIENMKYFQDAFECAYELYKKMKSAEKEFEKYSI